MAPSITGPDLADSTSTMNPSTFKPCLDQAKPSTQCSQAYGEHSSDISSNISSNSGASNCSRNNRSMNRGGGGAYRGGRAGHRTYSASSGSSSGQRNLNRPVLRPTSTSQGYATSLARAYQNPAGADSVVSRTKEQSSFTMNGYAITETYKRSGSASSTSPRPYDLSSAPTRGAYGGTAPGHLHATPRPVARSAESNWVHGQEYKIKILGTPKMCWTREVHKAMSAYGNIVRIEMQSTGVRGNNAWVVFHGLPLQQELPRQVTIGRSLTWEHSRAQVRFVTSPVNPSKHYYESNILFANSVDFGTNDAENSMINMKTVMAHGKVQLMLNLERKELDVQFPLDMNDRVRQFRFRLPIVHLTHVYKSVNHVDGQIYLVIPFDSPPQFFVKMYEGEQLMDGTTYTSFSFKDKIWVDWNTWFRETDVVDVKLKKSLQDMCVMNHKDTAIIDIGRWTSYRFALDSTITTQPQFGEFLSALVDHGVEIRDSDDYTVKDRSAFPLWSLLQEEISGTHPHLVSLNEVSDFDELLGGHIHLKFSVRYQLEACLSNGYLKEHNITLEFLETLAAVEPGRAIYILEKVVDKQRIYYDPMDIFQIQAKGSVEKKVPSYCILQRSAIITPTMIHVASPAMETSNRITRKYAADADRFLRVKFSDEKTEGVLRSMPNKRADLVFHRVRRAMRNGIVVSGRFYEFLAFGNSQFREHGAYFYAPTSSKSADDIRLSLGSFDHIKTVAKFGARLGQCFSTTRAMRIRVKIVKIGDIERNSYCFTDGVGKLSFFLAQMAAQELGLLNAFDDPPSLYQFRLGGCKGVLALDPRINGSEVHIRPSQQKFEAEYTGLEIIRSSALATPFFNRQIIIVLSSLGVPDHIFVRKQQEMVNDYEQAMIDEEIAVSKLRKHIDMNQTTLTMASMIMDGFMKSREPFIMSLLKLWRASTIKNLKEKARIAIEDGAFVLGCVDETANLKGHLDDPQSRLNATRNEKLSTLPEIFLQVDDTNKQGHYKIIEGICILARNPSLHPGDLRVVRAVDVPELHHLKNVVVLPQTGDRDLANMCSGGDLDGDDYMVLWDEDLIPENVNVPPMDFTPEKPIETTEPITIAGLSDFFVTYMQNDSLGQIAHAHLAQADFRAEGVLNETCLELAKLHSQAVDYPKSGIPAKMTHDLRPAKWPHFMEKKHMNEKRIYKSEKVLGMLYDQVQLVDFVPQWENPFDKRIVDAFDLDHAMLDKAAEIKVSYDESMRRLMAKHGIQTEFEAWSVFVLAHNNDSRDYKFAEEFGRTVGALKSQYKTTCREAAGSTSSADWSVLGRFVAAMYTVTAREMESALKECCSATKIVDGQEAPVRLKDPEHMPLISFPWLFASELGKIANGSSSHVDFLHALAVPRQKKFADIRNHELQFGEIETEGAVTHYGEILNLKFDKVLKRGKGHAVEVEEGRKREDLDLVKQDEELSPVSDGYQSRKQGKFNRTGVWVHKDDAAERKVSRSIADVTNKRWLMSPEHSWRVL